MTRKEEVCACVRACVRVKNNNDKLFFNALLFENSFHFSSG